MKISRFATASAVVLFAILPVQAQNVNSSPFGAAVFERWIEGSRLAEQGDFNSAQIQREQE
jgi:hypothetical protein